jgi:hypothetical protein
VLLPRLAGAVEAPVGARLGRDRVRQHHRAPGRRGAQRRVAAPDQAPAGGQVHRHRFLPVARLDVRHGRELGQHAGGVDEDVEPPEALHDRRPEHVELLRLLRRSSGSKVAARRRGADRVVRSSSPPWRARRQHAVRAEPRQLHRRRRADARATRR